MLKIRRFRPATLKKKYVTFTVQKELSPVSKCDTSLNNPYTRSALSLIAPQGFSIIELMVVISIVAILAGIAAPQFSSWLKDNRVEAVASQARGILDAARSEAISRGAVARVEFNSDALIACIVHDLAEKCDEPIEDAPVLHMNWDSKKISIGSNGAALTGITFDIRGRIVPRQAAISLTICDDRGASNGYVLKLNQIGRTSVSRLSDDSVSRCL